jgi:hypothetical protein
MQYKVTLKNTITMNTLIITLLSLNFVLTIAGLEYCIRHFALRNREVNKSFEFFKERIFELESMMRYDLQFELSELKNKQDDFKNKQDILEVKITKLSYDFSEFKFQIHTKKQAETLAKNVIKYMDDENEADSNDLDSTKTHETKPSESFKNEVVQVIRKDTNETLNLTRKVGRKYEKSKVKVDDIEIAFITKFNMTFYGYRQKYGEESFKKARYDAYQRAYYLKVKKTKINN